jgi:hypothetical protein
LIDVKVRVENNGAETIIDARIYTIWGYEAFSMYYSIITGLKNKRFDIWVNGLIWDDKWSIGSKKPNIIKAVPNLKDEPYQITMLTECANLNIQGIILRSDNKYLNLTCPRNMTL